MDVVWIELVGCECVEYGSVVGERSDRLSIAGLVSPERGNAHGVREPLDVDATIEEVTGDGPVATGGPSWSVGCLAIEPDDLGEVLASGHALVRVRRVAVRFLRRCAPLRDLSLDSLSR